MEGPNYMNALHRIENEIRGLKWTLITISAVAWVMATAAAAIGYMFFFH